MSRSTPDEPFAPALLLGDSLALLVFTLGGIVFHRVPGPVVAQAARIGLPFMAGYLLTAFLLGAMRRPASGKIFAARSALAWMAGIALGVLLRVVVEGHLPIVPFVLVTLAFNGGLLMLWRAVYWRLTS